LLYNPPLLSSLDVQTTVWHSVEFTQIYEGFFEAI
jgi:hypothetical protein